MLCFARNQPHQPMKTTTTRRDYIAIINNDERFPIEGLRAKDAAEARRQARREMIDVRGWTKYDGKLSIKVRLA